MGVVGIKTQRAAKLVDGSNSDANGDGNLNDLDDDDATDMPMPELRFDCTRLMVSSRYFGIEENNARKSCQVASMPGYRLE
jgi:hypothetical protein